MRNLSESGSRASGGGSDAGREVAFSHCSPSATDRAVSLWVIAGLTLLAGGIRFYHISTAALWTDEAFSLWVAKHSLPDIWGWTMRLDAHPPLYYILLHFWLAFGDREVALRALSATLGAFAVPVAYSLGWTLGGKRLGLPTAGLLALSPFNVWYSQEARMYPLLLLSAIGVMLGLARLLREPSTYGAWVIYILGATVALWTEHTAVLLLITTNLVVLLLRTPLNLARTFLRNWFMAQGVVLALWSPVVSMLIYQLVARNPGPTYLNGWGVMTSLLPDVFSPIFAARSGLSIQLRLEATALGLCVALILIARGLWAGRDDRCWTAFTLALWIVPIACGVLVGFIWLPVFTPATLTSGYRTLIWMSMAPYLLAARGFLALRRGAQAGMLVMLLISCFINLAVYYRTIPRWEEWDQSADYIARHVREDDLILFHDNLVQLPFDYYFRQHAQLIAERGVPEDFPAGGVREPEMRARDVARLQTLLHGHRRVWLVYSHEWWTDRLQIVPKALARMGPIADQRTFLGLPKIQVYLFEEGAR